MDIKELDKKYVMHTYARNDLLIDHGKGATLYDDKGNSYIDFTSGIGVSSIGYANEKQIAAVSEQISKLAHISNLYYTAPCAQVAEKLVERTGMGAVFFGNSGAEANEGMVKLARKYSFDKYGDGRSTILTLLNSFHGRTITTLKATGQDHFHEFFMPFTPGFSYAPANDYDALIAQVKDDTCAIMLELIQGEGGVMPMDKEYVQKVAAYCKEHDLLLLIDEVQTGIGRTGKLFAYMNYEIQPDVVSFAKGIAGGLPMGGFICSPDLVNVLGPGDHGSTFGGNPVACASASVVLDVLTDDVIAEVTKKGDYIRQQIASWNCDFVTSVRGMGLMIGIGLDGVVNKDLAKALMERGLLVLTAGQNTLRLLPPLTISQEELEKGLEIMAGLLKA